MPQSSRKKNYARSLTQADYEALARLRYLLRRFATFSASAAQAQGLPARQHQALLAIKGQRQDEPMTVGALAERLLITPHAATELVDRLQASRLVLRGRDSRDRRRLVLSLTAKAEAILRALSLVHLREIRATTPALLSVLARLRD
jgi:DNA-binding MarR family transcriptional regulator